MVAADERNDPSNNCHDNDAAAGLQKTLQIAPMLHYSNTEFRNFFRLLTKRATLWSEMVVDETVAFNAHDPYLLGPHLAKTNAENPVVCQIGGIDPKYTETTTRLVVEEYGYDEINLNMDCPSDRVSGRKFGAILMKSEYIDNAVEILQTMKTHARGRIPVSVKCRIGIDDCDSMEYIVDLLERLSRVCTRFVLHARKCLLCGLSPKDNRIVPPLNYPRVYALCERFPHCQFWINGGIPGLKVAKQIMYAGIQNKHQSEPIDETTKPSQQQQKHQVPCQLCNNPNGSCTAPPPGGTPPNLMGCMLGRAAMDHPAQFWDVDRYFYGCRENPCRNRRELLEHYCEYLERTYPRRCCDTDDRVTSRIPAPKVVHNRPYCSICQEFATTTKDTPTTVEDEEEIENHAKPIIKIYPGVIDRSLRPVFNLFFGIPGSNRFRRACNSNSRDLKMRNCGPAFLLRKAMQHVPAHVLDQDFVRTEDLKEEDIPVHVSPPSCPSSCVS
jgi:tRNA-dihydrouridine synthase A